MVSAGDIISFKYKSKSTGKTKTHSILVLNPSLIVKGQKKTTTQLIGIKLEESNKILLEITKKQIQIFELIGKFITIDKQNNLYKLDIDKNMIQNDIKGIIVQDLSEDILCAAYDHKSHLLAFGGELGILYV